MGERQEGGNAETVRRGAEELGRDYEGQRQNEGEEQIPEETGQEMGEEGDARPTLRNGPSSTVSREPGPYGTTNAQLEQSSPQRHNGLEPLDDVEAGMGLRTSSYHAAVTAKDNGSNQDQQQQQQQQQQQEQEEEVSGTAIGHVKQQKAANQRDGRTRLSSADEADENTQSRALAASERNTDLKESVRRSLRSLTEHERKKRERRRKGKKDKGDDSRGAPDLEKLKKEAAIDEHRISLKDLQQRFGLRDTDTGLTAQQVKEIREKEGYNRLSPPPKTLEWIKFLRQMVGGISTLLWIGAILCFVSFAIQVSQTSENEPVPRDKLYLGVVLAAVVFITGCFSYIQERRAADVMKGFAKLQPQKSRVRRNGRIEVLNAEELVRGDVVEVKAGDRIPADLRLVQVSAMKVDNSSLTGEAEPQDREAECTHDNPLETKNLAFYSTNVTEGAGTGVVIRCGDNTILGRIAGLTSGVESGASPIEQEVEYFTHFVTWAAILLGVAFLIIALVVGFNVVDAVVLLIGIIVAVVPEGLLPTLTVCLTLTAKRMATKNCLVKNLEAVETLGSTSTICSDKTGTLTQNNMTVAHVCFDQEIHKINTDPWEDKGFEFDVNDSFRALFRVATLCNKAMFLDAGEGGNGGAQASTADNGRGRQQELSCSLTRTSVSSGLQSSSRSANAANGSQTIITSSQQQQAQSKSQQHGRGQELQQYRKETPILSRATVGDPSESAIFKFTERDATRILDDPEKESGSYIVGERKKSPIVAEIPFNSKNKYQVSVHETPDDDDRYLLVMKGAPERIILRCSHLYRNGNIEQLTEEDKEIFDANYHRLCTYGERVLGFATLRLPSEKYPKGFDFGEDSEHIPLEGLVHCGLLALIDPPRPNVLHAVAKCRAAGIKVIMVTGDHAVTARAIAKQVGIIHSEQTVEDIAEERGVDVESVDPKEAGAIVIRDGSVLARMSNEELDDVLAHYQEIIFARTSPQQKLLIVEGCQRAGQVVAVTGDGVNDSPALKCADVGVAMGIAGSDVSKQAADIILLDDNFASIITGIEEGRLIVDNLKKAISYTLTSKLPQLAPFLFSVIASIPLPLGTVAILFIDLGTNLLPGISLAYEAPEPGIMSYKPQSSTTDRLVNPRLLQLSYLQVGSIQAAAGFFTYFTIMAENGFRGSQLFGIRGDWDNRDTVITDSHGQQWTFDQRKDLEFTCHTAYFIAVVVTQWAGLLTRKTRKLSLLQHGISENKVAIFALFFETGLAVLLSYTPGTEVALNLYPLLFRHWLTPLPFLALIVLYAEFRKFMIRLHPHGFFFRETYY